MTERDELNSPPAEPVIPFLYVGREVLIALANKLDPISHVTGNDWKLLAEKLGYTRDQTQSLEDQRLPEGRNTVKLLNEYIKKSNNSVQAVLKALKDMERDDAYKILLDAFPGIQQRMKDKLEEEMNGPEENSCHPYPSYPMNNSYMPGYSPVPGAWPPPPWPHPYMSHYMMHPVGIPYGNPPPCPSNSPHHPRPSKTQKTCHPGSHSPQCCGPHCFQRSNSHSGFYMSPQPTHRYNISGEAPHSQHHAFPEMTHPDFRSLEVNPSIGHGQMTFRSSDIENGNEIFDSEHPAPIARTIYKNQGHNLLSLSSISSKTQRSHSSEYNGDVSDSDESESNPSTPNNNIRPKSHRTYDIREPYNNSINNIGQTADYGNHFKDDVRIKMAQKDKKSVKKTNVPYDDDDESKCRYRYKSMSTGQPVANSKVENLESMMKKSLSLPNDLKPGEFQRVFKIKIFVTYSISDNLSVVNLCKCLEKNGFSCYVDVRSNEDTADSLELIKRKFQEADFVLVWTSVQYKDDTLSPGNYPVTSDGLHTNFIYQLMVEELKKNRNKNRRFVPLMSDKSSTNNIPAMLQGGTTVRYKWPSQYKDVLFMMTKPQERVSRHAQRPD